MNSVVLLSTIPLQVCGNAQLHPLRVLPDVYSVHYAFPFPRTLFCSTIIHQSNFSLTSPSPCSPPLLPPTQTARLVEQKCDLAVCETDDLDSYFRQLRPFAMYLMQLVIGFIALGE